jgi:hypothetical protein
MAYDPKRIDTRDDIRVFGFKEIGWDDSGKWIRVVFIDLNKAEISIQYPANLIEQLMPLLANATAECKHRSGNENVRHIFTIRSGSVSKAGENVVFDFLLPGGAHFTFDMDKTGASLLLSSLRKILDIIEPPSTGPKPARSKPH